MALFTMVKTSCGPGRTNHFREEKNTYYSPYQVMARRTQQKCELRPLSVRQYSMNLVRCNCTGAGGGAARPNIDANRPTGAGGGCDIYSPSRPVVSLVTIEPWPPASQASATWAVV